MRFSEIFKTSLFVCLLSFCAAVAKGQCDATFTHRNTGLDYEFKANYTASGATYLWYFGDSTGTATIFDPVHSYTADGSYTVFLVVSDSSGCSDTVSHTVNASANFACNAQFAINEASGVFYFTSAAGLLGDSTVTYLWDFGDSATSSFPIPNHTYSAGGNYTVCLTVTSPSGCSDFHCDNAIYSPLFTCNPLATLPFSGNANDISGNGNNGIVLGGAALTTDRNGVANEAYSFDGVNDKIGVNATLGNFGTSDYSIAFWMQTTFTGYAEYIIAKRIGCTAAGNDYWDVMVQSGKLVFESNRPNISVFSSTSVNDGNWHHVGIVRAGGIVTLYIDGQVDATLGGFTANLSNTGDFVIGTSPCVGVNGSNHFSGTLDEVAIFDCAIDSQDVILLMGPPVPPVCNANFYSSGSQLAYNFTSTSIGGNIYNWDFGDGFLSTLQNPTHNYSSAGTYSVCLTIADSAGTCSDTICKTITVTSTTTSCAAVASYPFDGNASDVSGNGWNATAFGATPTTDRNGSSGSAYSFDGVNDYVQVNSNSLGNFGTGSFTVAFWMQTSYTGFQEYVVSKRSGCTPTNLWEIVVKNGVVGYAENPPNSSLFGATLVNDGQWHHIAIVRQANNTALYVDGQLDASETSGYTANLNNSPYLQFGTSSCVPTANTNHFAGKLDEMNIYQCALTAQDVATLAGNPASGCNSAMADFPFNGNANDISGNLNDGTVSGAVLTHDRHGVANSAYSFNGTTSAINVNTTVGNFGGGNFSVAFWMQTNFTGFQEYVVSKRIGCNFSNTWEIMVNGGMLKYSEYPPTNRLSSATPVNDGAWHHIGLVRSNGTIQIYVDGQLDTAQAGFTAPVGTTGAMLTFGNSPCVGVNGSNGFGGKLDEMKLFACALSAQEMAALAANPGMVCEASFTSSPATSFLYNFTNTSTGTNLTYAWNFGDGTTSTVRNPSHTYGALGTYSVCLIISGTGCSDTICSSLNVVGSNCPATADYPFNGNANDVSGNGWHATAVGATLTQGVSGAPGSAYSFDGINDYVRVNNNSLGNFGSGNFSIAFWMQTSFNGSQEYVVSKRAGCTYTDLFEIVVKNGRMGYCENPPKSELFGSVPVNDGQWHHIAMVRDNATAIIYVDGQVDVIEVGGFVSTLNNTPNLEFGTSSCVPTANTNHFVGKLDEMKIFQCALSAQDVATLASATTCNARFNASSSSPYTYSFLNTSGGSNLAYVWDFGDGFTTDQQSPSHTYTVAGVYSVCLSIQDTLTGCTDTFCSPINVNTLVCVPEANFPLDASATDISGNGNNGTVFGPVPTTDRNGVANSAYSFDGVNDYISVNNSLGNFRTGELSIAFWMQTNYTGFQQYVVSKRISCSFPNFWNIMVKSGRLAFEGNAPHNVVWGNTVVNDGAWHHVAVTRSNDTLKLYVDGQFDTYTTGGINDFNNAANLLFGSNVCVGTAGSTAFLGKLDDIKIFECALSTQDIVTLSGNSGCSANFSTTNFQNVFTFNNFSTGSNLTYAWDFGDGSAVLAIPNPTHVYLTSGTYNACLTVLNSAGCSDTICQTITVSGSIPCNASFSYFPALGVYSFINLSAGNNLIYAWDFGDGFTSNLQSPSHPYAQGSYTACLVISDTSGCSDTICENIVVSSSGGCQASFSYTVMDSSVTFNNMSTSYTSSYWVFGDNTPPSNLQSPTHIYGQNGIYQACLTVIDTSGCSSNLCQNLLISGTTQQLYCLSGTVSKGTTSGGSAFPATVYLIYKDTVNGTLTAIRSTQTDANGDYSFCGVPIGTYLVKAALNSSASGYSNYVPTYYGNSLFWSYGIEVMLHRDLQQIDMWLIAGNNPGGPGFVSGYTTQGANKMGGPGSPVSGVQVLLLDLYDNPVQYIYSDSTGAFDFSNVAYGTYKIYGEVFGMPTYPFYVTIGPDNETADGIQVIVETTQVLTTGVPTSSINENLRSVHIYPNPTNTLLNVEITMTKETNLNVSITDITGKTISTENARKPAGTHLMQFDLSLQQPGVYFVRIAGKDNFKTFKVLKY